MRLLAPLLNLLMALHLYLHHHYSWSSARVIGRRIEDERRT